MLIRAKRLLNWLKPSTWILASDRWEFWQAWLFHLMTLGLGSFVLAVVLARNDNFGASQLNIQYDNWYNHIIVLIVQVIYPWLESLRAVTSDIINSLYVIIGWEYDAPEIIKYIIIIELILTHFGCVAIILIARDEAIRKSYWRCLQRSLSLTPAIMYAIILIALLTGFYERTANTCFPRQNSTYWQYSPNLPVGSAATPEALEALRKEYKAWSDQQSLQALAYSNAINLLPWWIRYYENVSKIATFILAEIAILWWLHLLRIGDPGMRCRWPIGCENCGYLLVALPRGAPCPECGASVESLYHADHRPGSPWVRAKGWAKPRAWCVTFIQSLFKPEKLGQSLRPLTHGSGPCNYLLYSLGFLIMISFPVLLATGFVSQWIQDVRLANSSDPGDYSPMYSCEITALVCLIFFIVAILISLIAGGAIAAYYYKRTQRNVYMHACHAVAYPFPILVVMGILLWILIVGYWASYETYLHAQNERTHWYWIQLWVSSLIAITIGCLSWFVLSARRILRSCVSSNF